MTNFSTSPTNGVNFFTYTKRKPHKNAPPNARGLILTRCFPQIDKLQNTLQNGVFFHLILLSRILILLSRIAKHRLRQIERNIRHYKRKALTQEAIGVDNSAARRKIGQWQAAARDFTQQTGIARDSAREFIGTKDGIQPRPLAPKPIPKN